MRENKGRKGQIFYITISESDTQTNKSIQEIFSEIKKMDMESFLNQEGTIIFGNTPKQIIYCDWNETLNKLIKEKNVFILKDGHVNKSVDAFEKIIHRPFSEKITSFLNEKYPNNKDLWKDILKIYLKTYPKQLTEKKCSSDENKKEMTEIDAADISRFLNFQKKTINRFIEKSKNKIAVNQYKFCLSCITMNEEKNYSGTLRDIENQIPFFLKETNETPSPCFSRKVTQEKGGYVIGGLEITLSESNTNCLSLEKNGEWIISISNEKKDLRQYSVLSENIIQGISLDPKTYPKKDQERINALLEKHKLTEFKGFVILGKELTSNIDQYDCFSSESCQYKSIEIQVMKNKVIPFLKELFPDYEEKIDYCMSKESEDIAKIKKIIFNVDWIVTGGKKIPVAGKEKAVPDTIHSIYKKITDAEKNGIIKNPNILLSEINSIIATKNSSNTISFFKPAENRTDFYQEIQTITKKWQKSAPTQPNTVVELQEISSSCARFTG